MKHIWEYIRFGSGYRRHGGGDSLFRQIFGLTSIHTRIRALHLFQRLTGDILEGPVLEVGFGDGYLLLTLARLHPRTAFEGWEMTAGQVENARRRARAAGLSNVTFSQVDLTAAPDPPMSRYGCVYSVDVLEHIPDDALAVRRMGELLRPGGRLVIHVPRRRSQQRRFLPGFAGHSDPGHVREEYTPEELLRLVDQAGLEALDMFDTFGTFGELAFELNSLFWKWRPVDSVWRSLTLPFLLPLGIWDAASPLSWGNSMLLVSVKEADPLKPV